MRRSFPIVPVVLLLFSCSALAQSTGQIPDLFGEGSSDLSGLTSTEPQLTAVLSPVEGSAGVVRLAVTVHVPPDSYTYSMNPNFGAATKIQIDETPGLTPEPGDFTADRAPKAVFEPLFNQTVEKYLADVTWTRDFRATAGATDGTVSVKGRITYQICDARTCIPYARVPFEAVLSGVAAEDPPATSHPYQIEETPLVRNQPGPATIRAELSPDDAAAGEIVTLTLTMTLKDDWHSYSLTQEAKAALPTSITVGSLNGLEPIDDEFQPSRPPEKKASEISGVTYRQEVYHGTINWSQRYRVLDSADAAGYGLAGTIKYQTCTGQQCLLPKTVAFRLGMVPVESASSSSDATRETSASSNSAAVTPDSSPGAADVVDDIRQHGLLPFLLTAVLAGFASLATPCVFPMIPITVSFFLKQSEKVHHRPITMASVYCGGIIATFTILGMLIAIFFRAAALNDFANNPWLNLGIAGVLVFFGLNLLGLFELRVPSWMLSWSAGNESRGGMAGVLFMALTFTLVSFTCTFPVAGTVLVWAARGEYFWPIAGMLAFSSAFALPFFFLALFPSVLKKLPESGGWMNSVKVTLGMIEVGAAFKFLSVADLVWNPAPLIFDYAFVMCAWLVISACTGLYLLGMFRLPHDSPSQHISVIRLSFAMMFLGLAGYLAVGLMAPQKPTGVIWEKIAAIAPPSFEGGEGQDLGPYLKHDGLEYALDYEQALEYASHRNLPVFLDFTGVNCPNCREMEGRMTKPHLREKLEKFVRIQLYADSVPTISDPEAEERIVEKNRALQENWFGDVTLPAYAVITPDRQVLARLKGLQDEATFAKFLDHGLESWNRLDARSTASAKEKLSAVDAPGSKRR